MPNTGRGPKNDNPAINGFAFAAGILTTLIVSPQLWWLSLWLGEHVFLRQYDMETTQILVFVSFALICWMSVSMARFGWSSTLVMGFVLIVSKIPVL